MKTRAGFTLIEIMVVVVIIGILAVLVVPNMIGRVDDARAVAAKQDVMSIRQALKLYKIDNGMFPTQEQGLEALSAKPDRDPIPKQWKTGGYLEIPPKDPWGNKYQYLYPGQHGEVDVFSYGSDGQPGGDGIDAEIGSWTN